MNHQSPLGQCQHAATSDKGEAQEVTPELLRNMGYDSTLNCFHKTVPHRTRTENAVQIQVILKLNGWYDVSCKEHGAINDSTGLRGVEQLLEWENFALGQMPTEEIKPEPTDWQARAEKAEAEVMRLDEKIRASRMIQELSASQAEVRRFREAIEGYLPFLPSTTFADGGAAKYSEQVRRSDALKAVLSPADKGGMSDDELKKELQRHTDLWRNGDGAYEPTTAKSIAQELTKRGVDILPKHLLPKEKGGHVEAPLGRRWRHSNGTVCCGTMRIMRCDFDTNPSDDYKKEVLDWVCDTLNEKQEKGGEG